MHFHRRFMKTFFRSLLEQASPPPALTPVEKDRFCRRYSAQMEEDLVVPARSVNESAFSSAITDGKSVLWDFEEF